MYKDNKEAWYYTGITTRVRSKRVIASPCDFIPWVHLVGGALELPLKCTNGSRYLCACWLLSWGRESCVCGIYTCTSEVPLPAQCVPPMRCASSYVRQDVLAVPGEPLGFIRKAPSFAEEANAFTDGLTEALPLHERACTYKFAYCGADLGSPRAQAASS